MRLKPVIAIVTLAALALVPAGTADARKRKNKGGNTVPTSIAIDAADDTGVVSGFVDSSQDECVDGRLVLVDVNGEPAGEAVADENGDWAADTGEGFANGDSIVASVEKLTFKSKKGKKGKTADIGDDDDDRDKKDKKAKKPKKKNKKKTESCGAAFSEEFIVQGAAAPPPAEECALAAIPVLGPALCALLA